MGALSMMTVQDDALRQPAEVRCAEELAALQGHDRSPKPPGWYLSPRAVETFVMGSEEPIPGHHGRPVAIAPKFVGDRRLIQVAIATLASDRALLLAGEPGNGKCVKHDTLVMDTRTGERLTIAEACRRRDLSAVSLGGDLRLRPQRPVDYLDNGVRSCFRVVTHLGREIEITSNHPLLTMDGWRPLAELAVGDRIAVPRVLPFFGTGRLSDAHVKLLAYLISEGCLTQNVPYFSNVEPAVKTDFSEAVAVAFPGLTARWYPDGRGCSISGGRVGPRTNPCTVWLRELGLMGKGSGEKFVPQIVFTLPREQIALFLNRLFSGDGSVHFRGEARQLIIEYANKSHRLVRDIQHLLSRFGLQARVAQRRTTGQYRLTIQGERACGDFLREIGFIGRPSAPLAVEHLLISSARTNPNLDTIPPAVWPRIHEAALSSGYAGATALVKADRGVAYKGGGPRWSQSISRPRLLRLATLTQSQRLTELAESDIYWDSISRIEYVGEHQVYDLSMAGAHNFVANDIIVHNSWLSEHLAAAISGTSSLTIQGTAGTSEEQIKYGWNYALLIAEGPSRRALVESPTLRGMQRGQVVRFEELTRCSAEVQDALISILSEQQIVIPELGETIQARRGFAVIATANTRDRGVNEMSAALKRRFNFVTIPVIANLDQESEIVERRSGETLAQLGAPEVELPLDLVRLLTQVFAELRRGETLDGLTKLQSPSTVLSTAELISTVTNGALMASYFGSGQITVRDSLSSMLGAVAKEGTNDLDALREYLETTVKGRTSGLWPDLYRAGRELL